MDQELGPSERGRRCLAADISFRIVLPIGVVVALLASWTDGSRGFLISLLIGVGVVSGFLVPLASKRRERLDAANERKRVEHALWGFVGRDREGVWINYVTYPVVVEEVLPTSTRNFYAKWLMIHDGTIVVNPGRAHVTDDTVAYDFASPTTYAWDGCTPKRWFWWLLVVGTPDFGFRKLHFKTIGVDGKCTARSIFWQRAHLASLVHDALCQYAHCVTLDRRQISEVFWILLKRAGIPAPIRYVYFAVVDRFGPATGGAQYHPRTLIEYAGCVRRSPGG